MALPKHYLFADEYQELAAFGFILRHPSRLRIIELLAKHKVLEKYEIVEMIPLSPAALSDHLRYLERIQLIRIGPTSQGGSGYLLNWEKYRYFVGHLRRWLDRVPLKMD